MSSNVKNIGDEIPPMINMYLADETCLGDGTKKQTIFHDTLGLFYLP